MQLAALNRQTWPLVLGILLVMTGVTLVAPILPLYARQFGVSRTAAGALISGFAVARLAFDLLGGVAGDRFGTRRVGVLGCLLLSGASVIAALAPNYGTLLVARVLEGTGSAAFATSAMQYLVQTTPKQRLGRTMAVFQMGLLAGVAIGPFLGGYAAQIGDFTTPFWIYAVLGLLAAALTARFVPNVRPEQASMGQVLHSARQLLRRPVFVGVLFLSFTLFVMRAGARVTLLPLYAGESLGLSEGAIGEILAISAVTNLVIVNPGGRLVDSVGRRPVAVAGLVLSAFSIALYGFVSSYPALLAVSALVGITAGLASIPPPTMVGDLAPTRAEGSAVGIYRTSGDLGFVIGPIVLGLVADAGNFRLGFLLAAGLLAAAALVVVLMPETRPAEDHHLGIVEPP
ncbi:MAG: MFS transporter [Actinomycetota bacterium]|nr:MFS transporter [Actinomycetota bacterium]